MIIYIGAVIPGRLVSYKYSQIEKVIRTEFLRQYGDDGRRYLKIVENGTSELCDTLLDENLFKTCLSFNLEMKTRLQQLFRLKRVGYLLYCIRKILKIWVLLVYM